MEKNFLNKRQMIDSSLKKNTFSTMPAHYFYLNKCQTKNILFSVNVVKITFIIVPVQFYQIVNDIFKFVEIK